MGDKYEIRIKFHAKSDLTVLDLSHLLTKSEFITLAESSGFSGEELYILKKDS